MGSQFDLRSAVRNARAKAEEAGRDVVDAVAKYNPQRLGRELGVQTTRMLVDAARRAPPGFQGQLFVAAAQNAPKKGARPPAGGRPGRSPATATPRRSASGSVGDMFMTLDAGVRGAADVLSFGKADEMEAGLEAGVETAVRSLPAFADGRNFKQRYETQLALQQERDRFDAEHRPVARGVGQVAGTVAGVAVGGGVGRGGAALVGRLPQGARILRNVAPVSRLGMDMRGVTRLSAAGGAAIGAAEQAVEDIARGELSDLPTYAAAAASGALGGVAGRYRGPVAAGAVAGGSNPAFQSLAAGEVPDLTDILTGTRDGGVGAGVAGRAAGALGKYGSSLLSPKLKGGLGEGLSYVKSVVREGRLPQLQVKKIYNGRKTIADQALLNDRLLEAKFGRWARLSKGQREALRVLGPKYLIDHYLPQDIGRIGAVGAGTLVGQAAEPPEHTPPTTAPHARPHAPPRSSR